MISFELTETQRMVQDMVHRFAEKEMRPVAGKYDEEESLPWEVMEKAERAGIMMPYVGDGDGGGSEHQFAGQFNTVGCIAAEELGWGCAGLTLAINGTQFAAGVVVQMGNREQKQFFNECLRGRDEHGHVKVAAMGFTEPQARSDVSQIRTSARQDGTHYVLNGQKQFVTNGSIASAYVIWATVDREAGRAGLRAFIIPSNTAGLRPGEKLRKMVIRASHTAPVYLDDCRVPAAWMMGEPHKGHREAKRIFDATRPMVAGCRSALPARREPNATLAAMAKAKAAEVAMDVTTKAVQILGGYGYVRDHPVEKWMRDAKVMDIFEGTGQIQRAIIAQGLTGVDCK